MSFCSERAFEDIIDYGFEDDEFQTSKADFEKEIDHDEEVLKKIPFLMENSAEVQSPPQEESSENESGNLQSHSSDMSRIMVRQSWLSDGEIMSPNHAMSIGEWFQKRSGPLGSLSGCFSPNQRPNPFDHTVYSPDKLGFKGNVDQSRSSESRAETPQVATELGDYSYTATEQSVGNSIIIDRDAASLTQTIAKDAACGFPSTPVIEESIFVANGTGLKPEMSLMHELPSIYFKADQSGLESPFVSDSSSPVGTPGNRTTSFSGESELNSTGFEGSKRLELSGKVSEINSVSAVTDRGYPGHESLSYSRHKQISDMSAPELESLRISQMSTPEFIEFKCDTLPTFDFTKSFFRGGVPPDSDSSQYLELPPLDGSQKETSRLNGTDDTDGRPIRFSNQGSVTKDNRESSQTNGSSVGRTSSASNSGQSEFLHSNDGSVSNSNRGPSQTSGTSNGEATSRKSAEQFEFVGNFAYAPRPSDATQASGTSRIISDSSSATERGQSHCFSGVSSSFGAQSLRISSIPASSVSEARKDNSRNIGIDGSTTMGTFEEDGCYLTAATSSITASQYQMPTSQIVSDSGFSQRDPSTSFQASRKNEFSSVSGSGKTRGVDPRKISSRLHSRSGDPVSQTQSQDVSLPDNTSESKCSQISRRQRDSGVKAVQSSSQNESLLAKSNGKGEQSVIRDGKNMSGVGGEHSCQSEKSRRNENQSIARLCPIGPTYKRESLNVTENIQPASPNKPEALALKTPELFENLQSRKVVQSKYRKHLQTTHYGTKTACEIFEHDCDPECSLASPSLKCCPADPSLKSPESPTNRKKPSISTSTARKVRPDSAVQTLSNLSMSSLPRNSISGISVLEMSKSVISPQYIQDRAALRITEASEEASSGSGTQTSFSSVDETRPNSRVGSQAGGSKPQTDIWDMAAFKELYADTTHADTMELVRRVREHVAKQEAETKEAQRSKGQGSYTAGEEMQTFAVTASRVSAVSVQKSGCDSGFVTPGDMQDKSRSIFPEVALQPAVSNRSTGKVLPSAMTDPVIRRIPRMGAQAANKIVARTASHTLETPKMSTSKRESTSLNRTEVQPLAAIKNVIQVNKSILFWDATFDATPTQKVLIRNPNQNNLLVKAYFKNANDFTVQGETEGTFTLKSLETKEIEVAFDPKTPDFKFASLSLKPKVGHLAGLGCKYSLGIFGFSGESKFTVECESRGVTMKERSRAPEFKVLSEEVTNGWHESKFVVKNDGTVPGFVAPLLYKDASFTQAVLPTSGFLYPQSCLVLPGTIAEFVVRTRESSVLHVLGMTNFHRQALKSAILEGYANLPNLQFPPQFLNSVVATLPNDIDVDLTAYRMPEKYIEFLVSAFTCCTAKVDVRHSEEKGFVDLPVEYTAMSTMENTVVAPKVNNCAGLIRLQQDVLIFPMTKIGASSVLKVEIQNYYKMEVQVRTVSVPPGFFVRNSQCAKDVLSTSYLKFPVSFKPTSVGKASGTLELSVSTPDGQMCMKIRMEGEACQ